MTKYLIYIFFLVFNLNLFAQNENFAVSNEECNILFRGYPTTIKLGNYQLIPSSEYTFEKINDQGEYIINVSTQAKVVTIEIGKFISGDQNDRNSYYDIQSVQYRVTSKIYFDLSLGSVNSGGILSSIESNIDINPSGSLALCFTIPVSNFQWVLTIDSGKEIKGTGKTLSAEALEIIKKAKKGAKIKIGVTFDTDVAKGLKVEGEFIK
jgi:hypothetical protein